MKKFLLIAFLSIILSFTLTAQQSVRWINMPDTSTAFPIPLPDRAFVVLDSIAIYQLTTSFTTSDNLNDVIQSSQYKRWTPLDTLVIISSDTVFIRGHVGIDSSGIFRDSLRVEGFTLLKDDLTVNGHILITGTGRSVFIGEGAGLVDDLTTNFNVFIGTFAGENNINGFENIAIGMSALQTGVSTSSNIAIGRSALGTAEDNTSDNIAIGDRAMGFSLRGIMNVAIGDLAMATDSGKWNVAIGGLAGKSIRDGTDLNRSDSSIFMGYDTKANAENEKNQIVIGFKAIGKGSHTGVYGNPDITDIWLPEDGEAIVHLGSITFPNSATISNVDADTLDITEANIKIIGNLITNSIIGIGTNADITISPNGSGALVVSNQITENGFDAINADEIQNGFMKKGYWLTTDDYIEVADDIDIDVGMCDFSIGIRFRLDNVSGTKYLINKEAGGIGYGIYITDDDIYIRLDDNTADASGIILTAKVVADVDYSLFISFDRSGDATAYLQDLNTTGTVDISGSPLTLSNAGNLRIGSTTAGANFFTGIIYESELFNRAFTSVEIKQWLLDGSIPFKYQGASNDEMITDSDNTDFADGTINDWVVASDGTGTCIYDGINPGAEKVAKLTVGGTAGTYTYGRLPTGNATVLEVGRRYRLSANVYMEAATTWSLLYVRLYDGTTFHSADNISASAEGTWLTSTIEFTATNTDNQLDIVAHSIVTGDVVYFDNITLTQIGNVGNWNQNGISADTWYDASENGNDGTNSGAIPSNPIPHFVADTLHSLVNYVGSNTQDINGIVFYEADDGDLGNTAIDNTDEWSVNDFTSIALNAPTTITGAFEATSTVLFSGGIVTLDNGTIFDNTTHSTSINTIEDTIRHTGVSDLVGNVIARDSISARGLSLFKDKVFMTKTASGTVLEINSEGSTENAALYAHAKYAAYIEQDITGGYALRVRRNIANTELRALVELDIENATDEQSILEFENAGSGYHITTAGTNEDFKISTNGTGAVIIYGNKQEANLFEVINDNDGSVGDSTLTVSKIAALVWGNGASIDNIDADTLQLTETVTKIEGELILGNAVVKHIDMRNADLGKGANSPDNVTVGNNAGWSYDINDDSHMTFVVPHDWKAGTDFTIKVLWCINEAYTTNSGEIRWQTQWSATAIGEAADAAGTTDNSGDVNIPATIYFITETTVETISGASVELDDVIGLIVSRVAIDGGTPNPTADPVILDVHIEYYADKIGE